MMNYSHNKILMKNPDDCFSKSHIEAFTDGACLPRNPGGYGAFAAVIVHEGRICAEFADIELQPTTSPRMELQAAILILQQIPPGKIVTIISDCTYVVKGINNPKWIPQKNFDLWETFRSYVATQNHVSSKHIRGHSGNPFNDRAHNLADICLKSFFSDNPDKQSSLKKIWDMKYKNKRTRYYRSKRKSK